MRMQFTTQQLTSAAIFVAGGFIALAIFLSTYTPSRLSSDYAYPLPPNWPYSGLVPPRGSSPAVSRDFLAISTAQLGHSFDTTEGVHKQGICFSHESPPEKMTAYFNAVLSRAEFSLSDNRASGRDADNVLAVWNSEYGNISVILRYYGERYELLIHGE